MDWFLDRVNTLLPERSQKLVAAILVPASALGLVLSRVPADKLADWPKSALASYPAPSLLVLVTIAWAPIVLGYSLWKSWREASNRKYSGPLAALKDFEWEGFDWRPVRVYTNGISDTINVTGPKCRRIIGKKPCKRILVPSPDDAEGRLLICPNTDCERPLAPMQQIYYPLTTFLLMAKREATALDEQGKLKFPPIPK